MNAPLLVFDLDGTLVDTAPDLLATLDAVLPRHGFKPMADASLRDTIGHGARHMIKQALSRRDVTLSDQALDAINDDFLAHYEANICRHSRLYPGTEALLDRFAEAGWRFAVCTNKKEHLSKLLLQAIGVSGCFAAICGGDTFAAPKPDPTHLGGTIAAASGTPAQTLMVGDSRTDRDAARNVGVAFVGVNFGYTDVPMAKLGADLLIDHFDELTMDAAKRLLANAAMAGATAVPAPGS